MTRKKAIEQAKEEAKQLRAVIENTIFFPPALTPVLLGKAEKILALLEQAEPSYEPTASEISSYISAWDGDISEEEARSLLKEANRKDEQLPQFEDIVGLYKDEERTEPVCPICGLTGEQAKLPHTHRTAEPPCAAISTGSRKRGVTDGKRD